MELEVAQMYLMANPPNNPGVHHLVAVFHSMAYKCWFYTRTALHIGVTLKLWKADLSKDPIEGLASPELSEHCGSERRSLVGVEFKLFRLQSVINSHWLSTSVYNLMFSRPG